MTITKTKNLPQISGTYLVKGPGRDLESAFRSEESIDGIVGKITEAARGQAAGYDATTSTGRSALKSVAHTVAKSKTALDAKGKELNEERRAEINAVDAGRRKIREQLDALRDEIRKPVTDWEAAEEKRIERMESRLAEIAVGHIGAESSAADIEGYIDVIAKVRIDATWREYQAEASDKKDATIKMLAGYLDAATRREVMERELEALRAANAENERLAAFEAMQTEAEAANAEFDRRASEAVERAARAADQAKRDAEAAEKEAIEQATRKAEAEAAAIERAQAARDHDERLRKTARADIVNAISGLRRSEVIDALMSGKIPHVKLVL